MKKIITTLTTLLFSASVLAEKPQLTVYTYDSFASKYGPATKLTEKFEAQCQCTLKFVALDNGVTMLNRFRLEGKKSKADVLLGLDQATMLEAEKTENLLEHGLQNQGKNLPLVWQNPLFFPYDFGEFTFIYNKKKITNPPTSLKELVKRSDLRIIYQDPRTSTTGRGLLLWINAVFGEQAEKAWQQLAKHTVTIGKGWSETYGAFLKGEADLVLSYSTSPLYHQWYEQNDDYVAASFSEGHLSQIETAAITKTSQNPALARQFLAFLQQPEAQKIIATHNIMKPVISDPIDPKLTAMPTFKALSFEQPSLAQQKQWIAVWQKAVSQ